MKSLLLTIALLLGFSTYAGEKLERLPIRGDFLHLKNTSSGFSFVVYVKKVVDNKMTFEHFYLDPEDKLHLFTDEILFSTWKIMKTTGSYIITDKKILKKLHASRRDMHNDYNIQKAREAGVDLRPINGKIK